VGTRATVGRVAASALILLTVACSSRRSVTGIWNGSLTSPGTTPVGVQFALQEQSGQLTGQTFVQDPVTGEYLVDDDVTGTRTGSAATWKTSTGLVVKGTFDAEGGFSGTLEFPADDPLAIHVVDLNLHG
jgi:hypothetical protein